MDDDKTDAIIDEHQRFVYQLGLFVLTFKRAEDALYRTLLAYSGVSAGVGRAIFSGSRMSEMSKYLLAILENTPVSNPQGEHLKWLLAQFTAINTERAALVHYATGDVAVSGVRVTTDRASREKNILTYRVSADEVQGLTSDLQTIALHLTLHSRSGAWSPPPADWPIAWLYKPRQPSNTQQPKPQKAPQKQRGQRPSSRR